MLCPCSTRWLVLVVSLFVFSLLVHPCDGSSSSFSRPSFAFDWSFDLSSDPSASSPSARAAASRANPSDGHIFYWFFPHRNADWLDAEFEALTNPTSPRYLQHHISTDTIMSVIGPSAEDKAAVLAWLSSQAVADNEVTDYGDVLRVVIDVGRVESMFNTTMHYFVRSDRRLSTTLVLDSIQVPTHLSSTVKQFIGLYDYPTVTGRMAVSRSPAIVSESQGVQPPHPMHSMQTEEADKQCGPITGLYPILSPATLASIYCFDERNNSTTPLLTRAAVVGGFSLNEGFSQVDLSQFRLDIGFSSPFEATVWRPPILASDVLAEEGPSVEASLDIEALFQITPTSNNSFWSETFYKRQLPHFIDGHSKFGCFHSSSGGELLIRLRPQRLQL